MLTAVLILAILPAFLILGLGLVARTVAAQRLKPRVVQYTPERDSTVLRDALLVDADRRAASAALIDLAVKRKVRLLAGEGKREPIGVELVQGAVLTAEETALLEALFGPEHTSTRVRRFSADRRALAGRLKSLLLNTEHALARDGLVAERRVTWPGVTLTVFAYLGMLVEALFLVFTIVSGEWGSLIATLVAIAATIATIFVTPSSWRRFLPAADARREHLAGLRQYIELAEADRLRVLQSPSGADLRTTDAAAPEQSDPVTRFHLHERLLPHAVIFGLERDWIAKLKLEHAELDQTNLDTLGDLVDVTAEIAAAIHAAGSVVELTSAVGDLADGTGTAIGGVFELFNL
ncbi:hypothetical protein BJY17_001966 [Agromyces hippuratus]|uniref:Predicted membrane protein YciQ-like C-terminal domain-containing protein n=1 Tax=Agromyces hippuratus TaxID=286438 RepID=A0A852WTE3_9MICO|nr:DUF2207 domain-containing protein [Agromyces hippuratus]NYG21219.1 hypothetical protein [Agromyces hippuratus]